jgi:hypothetical protein
MKLSVLRLHSISGKMINEDEADGEITVGRGNQTAQRKPIPVILSTKNPT